MATVATQLPLRQTRVVEARPPRCGPNHRHNRDPGLRALVRGPAPSGRRPGGLRRPIVVSVAMLVAMFVVWPLFIRFFFKLVIWTAGLITVLVNGFIVQVVSWISPNCRSRTSAGPFSLRSYRPSS